MKRRSTVQSLQIMRGLAASSVVLHHIVRGMALNATGITVAPLWFQFNEFLAIGVDIFFVISGFIMVYISSPYLRGDKPVYDFMALRVIRVYPIYLVGTLLLLLQQVSSFSLAHGSGFNMTAERILSSIFLIPSNNENGSVQPILGVGWTLSYEMYFYIVFSAAIFLRNHINWLLTLCVSLVGINIVACALGGTSAGANFLSNKIVFEFLFGCGIALAYRSGNLQRVPFWLSLSVFFAALVFGLGHTAEEQNRFLYWGLFSGAFVVVLLKIELAGFKSWPRSLILVGDASYSIYIFHIIFLYLLFMPFLRLSPFKPLATWQGFSVVISVGIALIAIGIGIHLTLERYLNDMLSTKYKYQIARRRSVFVKATAAIAPERAVRSDEQ